jgi:hypothetical protein
MVAEDMFFKVTNTLTGSPLFTIGLYDSSESDTCLEGGSWQ